MPAVRAAVSFAPTPSKRRPVGVSFTTAATTAVAATAKYTGIGIPSQSPPPILASRAVVVRRDAGRVPEHDAVEERVRAERRDDRVEAHPADQEPVEQAGGDRREKRDADRGQEPGVLAGRVVREDHDVEGQPAGDREVDAALHDHERLAERRDGERRGERQHRQEHASREARRREQARSPRTARPSPRSPSRGRGTRTSPRSAWDRTSRLVRTGRFACRRHHLGGDSNVLVMCSQVVTVNTALAVRPR